MDHRLDTTVRRRIDWVIFFFSAVGAVLIARLFMLQIVQHQLYASLASRQQRAVAEVAGERGRIFAKDKEGRLIPLALNKVQKNLIASPKDIKNPDEVALVLAKELRLDQAEVAKKLSRQEDPYEVIAKRVEETTVKKLEELKFPGLFFEEEKRRVYPHGTLAAHLIGFASKEEDVEEGRYGLERFYERELSGKRGFLEGAKDAAGFFITLGRRIIRPPENGADLILTVDYNIQLKTEEVLAGTRERWGAAAGGALVLEPSTGKILALAASPSFDPNFFSRETDYSRFLNPLVESVYELGSVLKPVTMAGGLNEGVVRPTSTYEDKGEVRLDGYTIRNYDGKARGVQTMTQVLEKSLNTGAVYVARLLGEERQLDYFTRFGFGAKTDVDLSGEVPGDLSNLQPGREVEFATASYGQGIAVTPLQLASAIAAIANGGRLMQPYVIDTIGDDSGGEERRAPLMKRRVISEETAETLTKILVSVVRNGLENRAGVKGYFVAAKTGTAQIPRHDAPGYTDAVMHTFVGYAPAFSPRFLTLLFLQDPKGNRFASNTLAIPFRELAEYILHYYEVPSDER